MTTVSLSDMRANIGDWVSRVAYSGERLVLRRNKRDMAAVVSLEDLRLLEELEMQDDLKAYRKAKREYEKDGKRTVSLEEAFKGLEA